MSACKTITEPSKKYDELYTKALKILDDFNPCKIENGICLRSRSGGRNFCQEKRKSCRQYQYVINAADRQQANPADMDMMCS